MTVTFLDLIHALLVPTNFSKILPWLLQRSQKCSTHSSTLQRSKKCSTHYSTFYNRFCKLKEMMHSLFYILQLLQLLQRSKKCYSHYNSSIYHATSQRVYEKWTTPARWSWIIHDYSLNYSWITFMKCSWNVHE